MMEKNTMMILHLIMSMRPTCAKEGVEMILLHFHEGGEIQP